MGPNYAFSMLTSTPAPKKYITAGCVVVTTMSYAKSFFLSKKFKMCRTYKKVHEVHSEQVLSPQCHSQLISVGWAWTMVKMWKPLNFEEEGPDFSDFERVGGGMCAHYARSPPPYLDFVSLIKSEREELLDTARALHSLTGPRKACNQDPRLIFSL